MTEFTAWRFAGTGIACTVKTGGLPSILQHDPGGAAGCSRVLHLAQQGPARGGVPCWRAAAWGHQPRQILWRSTLSSSHWTKVKVCCISGDQLCRDSLRLNTVLSLSKQIHRRDKHCMLLGSLLDITVSMQAYSCGGQSVLRIAEIARPRLLSVVGLQFSTSQSFARSLFVNAAEM